MVHDLSAAAERADGKSAADDLAEGRQVWHDVVECLSAAPGDAKPGHYLVEYQDAAVPASEFAQPFQISWHGRYATHVTGDRFEDHRGDLLRVSGEGLADGFEIVERQGQRLRGNGFWNTRAVGNAERQNPGSCLDEQRVGVTVVAAVELDDEISTGKPARQTDGRHGRFGPGVDHADLLDARYHCDDQLG